MTKTRIDVFIDSNLFLHYRRIDEIKWDDLFKADELWIVITPIVIRELESNKIHNNSKALRDRAAKAIRYLADLSKDGSQVEIIKNTSVIFITTEPTLDFNDYQLDKSLYDDYLIAHAIENREIYLEHTTQIITADLGLSLKARSNNFGVIEPPEDYKLPDVKDAAEKELLELKRELKVHKDTLPQLILSFSNGQKYYEKEMYKPRPFKKAEIKETMSEIMKSNPKMRPLKIKISDEGPFGELTKSLVEAASILTEPTAESIKTYNEQLDRFYGDYETHLSNYPDSDYTLRLMKL